jgi:hypothetical protein
MKLFIVWVLPLIVIVIKLGRLKEAEHVARMQETWKAYKI